MKAVVDDFTRIKNKVGDKITPIHLYSIRYEVAGNKWLRYTDYSENVTFDGIEYQRYVVKHSKVSENLSGTISKVTLSFGNIDRNMQYYLDNYDGLKDMTVKIKLVWKEYLNNAQCYLEDEYSVNSSSANQNSASLVLGSPLDVLDVRLPKCYFYRYYCRFAFKDTDCGYSGIEKTCDKTFKRCQELVNTSRFGGFPAIPTSTILVK